VESIHENLTAPLPDVEEVEVRGQTNITYAGAIRAAIDHIISDSGGFLLGQDVARLGGVMQATAGLLDRHPGRMIDAPLNEPLIVGTACGAGLHEDLIALPEVQFGDYSLNAFHWLVHMGNLFWTTNGNSNFATILRTPVDPFGGGAVYHSMSIDGYFSPIPGLVLCMPSTSWDVYGLLMSAADYRGPVVMLEPKWMYRQSLGPAFPGEPEDAAEIKALKKHIMRGGIPEIDSSLRVPIGKAAVRRSGSDITVVAWGRAVWTAMDAAQALSKDGIEAEVIDLRTLVPPDMDTVFESVGRTGRLVVAAEDRSFAGFVRSIQGAVVDKLPGLPTRAIGQKNIPGIAQSLKLENATILTSEDIVTASREVLEIEVGGGPGGWSWIPPRHFIN
jgi:pyruvate/2-oxoglutarate/acetoin dehydrogenase E1 component